MSHTAELEDFCQVLVSALASMQKANEFPSYMSAKARAINAANIHKSLDEKIQDGIALTQLMQAKAKNKVCSEDAVKSKENLLDFILETKPFIDRIKDGNFKLILDRFMAAHYLAVSLSDIVDEIIENEKLKDQVPAHQV